jgi:hypothetical protein
MHHPHERGDFIWRLSDALLAKALELSPPHYPTIDSLLSCIGSPCVWWSRLVASQPSITDGGMCSPGSAGASRPLLPMQRVKLVVDLLSQHGVYRCPRSGADFVHVLLQFRRVQRVREWIFETRSTDGLWPMRDGRYRNESLLETAIQLEASAPLKHKSNATGIARYLQTEYDTWVTVH